VVSALSAAGVFTSFKKLAEAAKMRSDAKSTAEHEHADAQRLLEELKAGQVKTITRLQDENAQLRVDVEELKKKNLALESKNDKLTTALSLTAGAKEKQKI